MSTNYKVQTNKSTRTHLHVITTKNHNEENMKTTLSYQAACSQVQQENHD